MFVVVLIQGEKKQGSAAGKVAGGYRRKMADFELVSAYKPTGDQPQAIEKLTEGVLDGIRTQVLVGVTGSGKTFTMANVIKNVNRPTLVIAHNKTLAAQLCNEFREFFRTTAWSILSAIMIIISRRVTFRVRTHI